MYRGLGIVATRFDSARNLHRAIKEQVPDFFVGEFHYALGNDYAGNTISNLDVTLRTHQAFAPRARIILVMQPGEAAHVDRLLALFPAHGVLTLPVFEAQMGRVVDRFRTLDGRLPDLQDEARQSVVSEMAVLGRRTGLIHRAIALCTGGALLVCMIIASLFILAMVSLVIGLLFFLREIQLSTGYTHVLPR